VQVEEQYKHQEQEYVVPGQIQGTDSSANIKGSFSQSERKSIGYRARIQSVLEYARATWGMNMEDMARLERTKRMIKE